MLPSLGWKWFFFFFFGCCDREWGFGLGIWDGPLAHLSIPKEIECCYRHQKFHTLIIHLLLTWNGTLHTTIAQNNKYQWEREFQSISLDFRQEISTLSIFFPPQNTYPLLAHLTTRHEYWHNNTRVPYFSHLSQLTTILHGKLWVMEKK